MTHKNTIDQIVKQNFVLTLQTLMLLGAFALLTVSCTLKKPAVDTPVPDEQRTPKSFFIKSNGEAKTFMVGYASEAEAGYWGKYMYLNSAPMTGNLNVKFRITKDLLIADIINTSKPKDPRQRQALMVIPIVKHYYYERARDANGRETNQYIENDQRSHWSARPYIKLDFRGTTIVDIFNTVIHYAPAAVLSVDDLEWDLKNNFLGFTASMINSIYGSGDQTTVRMNFLEIPAANPGFKKTPYKEENSEFFSILDLAGYTVSDVSQGGERPVLHAAHWDLSKSREVRLVGFPEEYEQIGIDSVEAWNKTFEKIGAIPKGHKPFIPVVVRGDIPHPFDLRHTTIHWIDDMDISNRAPLGIGQKVIDYNTGEILWGKVTVYAGKIVSYIKSFQQLTSAPSASSSFLSPDLISNSILDSTFRLPDYFVKVNDVSRDVFRVADENTFSFIDQRLKASSKDLAGRLQQPFSGAFSAAQDPKLAERQRADLEASLQGILSIGGNQIRPEILKEMFAQLQNGTSALRNSTQQTTGRELLKRAHVMDFFEPHHNEHSDALAQPAANNKQSGLNNKSLTKRQVLHGQSVACTDRTFEDVIGSYQAAAVDSNVDIQPIVDGVIYELLLHEIGHVLNLGHQFKENILPAPDRAPKKIYNELAEMAKPENRFINATSVMGYRSPKAELATYDKPVVKGCSTPDRPYLCQMGPGIQDELVLRYLYKQEVPTYKAGDPDYKFVALPKSGVIPQKFANGSQTAYLPQCNDWTASMSMDPFCNRFDYGNTAPQIVQSYIDFLKDNIVQRLFAFSDSRTYDKWDAESSLFFSSMRVLNRIRIFYDYMRLQLETHFEDQWNYIREHEMALFEFSRACGDNLIPETSQIKQCEGDVCGPQNAIVERLKTKEVTEVFKKVFDPGTAKGREMIELCQANKQAIAEFTKIISLPVSDYSRVDVNRYFSSIADIGGDARMNYSKVFGTWRELGAFPMKLAAIFNMLSPSPLTDWGRTIPNYSNEDFKFSYSTLYPQEYVRAMTASVESNLRFANIHKGESTHIGRSVIALGVLDSYYIDNEAKRLPPQYIDKIRAQTVFSYSYLAIVLIRVEDKDNKFITKKFTAYVYDFSTNRQLNADEVFVFPDGKVLVRAENMFIANDPDTRLRFFDDNAGYVMGYRLSYTPGGTGEDDVLWPFSVKQSLQRLHDDTLDACIRGKRSQNGESNGLTSFFNVTNKEFKGFRTPPGFASDQNKRDDFFKSVQEAFDTYHSQPNSQPESVCQEAVKGLEMVISAAALLNGYFLPGIFDQIEN